MLEYTQEDISSQVANLPLAFRFWFQWMFAVIVLAPGLFIRRREGRVAVLFYNATEGGHGWSSSLGRLSEDF